MIETQAMTDEQLVVWFWIAVALWIALALTLYRRARLRRRATYQRPAGPVRRYLEGVRAGVVEARRYLNMNK